MNPDIALVEAGLALRKADLVIVGGKLVNVLTSEIYPADVAIYGKKIVAVGDVQSYIGSKTRVIDAKGSYMVPGLIDGHIHFEVTKLSVTMFAKLMLPRGTTSIVTSLDQIFGVAGLKTVRDFLEESKSARLRMFFGAPCKLPYTIPASTLRYCFGVKEHVKTGRWKENVGVWETIERFTIGSGDGKTRPDRGVWKALDMAYRARLPAYGSASVLKGTKLAGYICAGIRSDHEAYSPEEFVEKLRNGLYYMIRESSVAHFLDGAIRTIVKNHIDTRRVAFCTDDVTSSDVLKRGHLDNMVRTAIRLGIEPIRAIQMATVNCAEIYHVDNEVGSISPGRFADVILTEKLNKFVVKKVIAYGQVVAADGEMVEPLTAPNRSGRMMRSFPITHVDPNDVQVRTRLRTRRVRAISMKVSPDIPFVRKRVETILTVENGVVLPSAGEDILYVTVVARHRQTRHRSVAFISGFNLKHGAIASSVSPDDNNIVCIGADNRDAVTAINRIIDMQGGQVVVDDGEVTASIDLPIGGIMADTEPEDMAQFETRLDDAAKELGSQLESPFMSMIFLSVTGVPDYAITDRGLIDSTSYKIVRPILGPA